MPRERLNVVDLFAGCGALSAGFAGADAADCRIVCANEMNPVAAESFRANHPDAIMISRDIRSVDSGEIGALAGLKRGDVDAVVGGPPCQGFSTVGNREDDDPRNIMFLEFVRMVRELRPRVAVMENVPQFLSASGGGHRTAFADSMDKAGYRTECAILVASDYGVPQVRRRAFCISVEKDLPDCPITFPSPTHQGVQNATMLQRGEIEGLGSPDPGLERFVSVGDAIGDLPSLGPEKESAGRYLACRPTRYQRDRRKWAAVLTEHEYWGHGPELLSYISGIPEGSRMVDAYKKAEWRGSGFHQAYARLHRKGIGNTITTSLHNPGSGRFIHYQDIRAISIREAARLQGFDDGYLLVGSKVQKRTQVGNAVPPLLARSVAEHVCGAILRRRAVPVVVP